MRSILLVLNILIGLIISANSPEISAASSGKNKSHKAHLKNKAQADPGDVWDRIRSGMRIPQPRALVSSSDQETASLPKINEMVANLDMAGPGTTTVTMSMRSAPEGLQILPEAKLKIRPHTIVAPSHNYTELGRLRLEKKKPAATIISCNQGTSTQVRQENAQKNKLKIAQLNEFIRSEMGFHPELRKHTVIVGPDSQNNIQTSENKPPVELSEKLHIGRLLSSASHNPCVIKPEPQVAAIDVGKQPELSQPQTPVSPIPARPLVSAEQANKQAMIDGRINKHIAAYTQNPGFISRVAERAHPYLYHIVEGLSKHQLPMELALLPIVESAYQPTAQSPKSAAGLWQFIPSTGKDFDLEQSEYYDERLDIPESTQAAIRFLSGLKNHFKGDWLLALAAYNSGQGTVDNAISRNQAEGLPTDFWSLRLPEETQNYVPRLLALSSIISHPGSYGIKLPKVRNEPYFVRVKVERPFAVDYLAEKDISLVAKLANLTTEQFSRLNPGYLNATLSRNGPYTFLMPVENAKQLQEHLASIEKFIEKPAAPVKSVVLKDKPESTVALSTAPLSLISEWVLKKPVEDSKFSAPFLSLKLDDKSNSDNQPLA